MIFSFNIFPFLHFHHCCLCSRFPFIYLFISTCFCLLFLSPLFSILSVFSILVFLPYFFFVSVSFLLCQAKYKIFLSLLLLKKVVWNLPLSEFSLVCFPPCVVIIPCLYHVFLIFERFLKLLFLIFFLTVFFLGLFKKIVVVFGHNFQKISLILVVNV